MKFKRHKQSTRKIGGSRRRQHSPPIVDKEKLQARTEDGAKVSKPKKKLPRKKEELGGNTPRAFAELMSRLNRGIVAKGASEESEKDGNVRNKKEGDSKKEKKRLEAIAAAEKKARSEARKREDLKMLPNESFADFTRRVNEALPVVRAKSGAPSMEAIRKMKKREIAEANGQKPLRSKHKKGAAADEEEYDDGVDYSDDEAEERRYMELKTKRSSSPDPWKRLSRPAPPKFGEIAAAPPVLKPPSKKLVNVPKKAGQLSERLALEAEREQVIGKYRAMVERNQRKLHPEDAV
ncbi:hypothetical protein V1520DRAFT_334534 [Lipomyces starkeyi]|uniref:Uncharacterized protein n=1 Tax=Lipomyces starkeyi NRRL Y-11557 TaxID=675824 RepID=A0A1E3Q774_LIPST|nr:hypothetical protein LIPSTDRAFT_62757 [Lipomyces starkeyi NRRL Y-11557]